MNSVTFVC